MRGSERQDSPGILAAIALALIGALAVDAATPLGVAEWVFYLVPVALTLYTSRAVEPNAIIGIRLGSPL